MKIFKNKISVLVLLAVFSATLFSCKKDLTELNENPNDPGDVPAKYVLAHVQENTVYTVSYRIEQDFANFWVQHWAATNYLDEDWYELRDATMNNSWNAFYAQTMMDCKHLITRGGTDNQGSLVAIGKIMRAYNLYQATNMWGAIPYSQAFQSPEILTPLYDNQEDIYTGVIADLKSALQDINSHVDDGPGSFDLIFGGDMTMWSKFAKGLLLKVYFNAALVKTAYQTEVASLINDADFPYVNTSFAYSGAASNENPNWKHLTIRTTDAAMGKTLVDYMIGNGDSINPADMRLPVYAAPVIDNDGEDFYRGLSNGVAGDGISDSWVGYFTENPGAAYYYFTMAEAYFIQAEAIERGWVGGSAEQAYKNGVEASFDQFGAPYDEDAFFTGQPWAWGAEDNLTQINTQKWVALFTNGLDAWTNWRRVKTSESDPSIPALVPSTDNTNNGLIPVRTFYGTEESTVNQAGYTSGIAENGNDGNGINTTLWFMQY